MSWKKCPWSVQWQKSKLQNCVYDPNIFKIIIIYKIKFAINNNYIFGRGVEDVLLCYDWRFYEDMFVVITKLVKYVGVLKEKV